MKRIFVSILLILALICGTLTLSSCAIINPDADGEYDDRESEYQKKLGELTHRKRVLLSELDALESNANIEELDGAYMSFIFTGLDALLYDVVYPIMSEGDAGFVGIMAFSPEHLPGLEGKITVEQYDELIELGWGTAIYWNGEGDLAEYISEIFAKLDEMSISHPTTVVFKNGAYKLSYDEVLESFGILNAIHSGEEELPQKVSGAPEGVWHPGRAGWKSGVVASRLKRQVESEGGYALLEINFDNSEENTSYSFSDIPGEVEGMRLESFKTMVNLFKTSIKRGDIRVLDLETTREAMEKYYRDCEEMEQKNAQRIKDINAEISEIDRSMTELYSQYFGEDS